MDHDRLKVELIFVREGVYYCTWYEIHFLLGLPRPVSAHLRDDIKRDEQGRLLPSGETTPMDYLIDTGGGNGRFLLNFCIILSNYVTSRSIKR